GGTACWRAFYSRDLGAVGGQVRGDGFAEAGVVCEDEREVCRGYGTLTCAISETEFRPHAVCEREREFAARGFGPHGSVEPVGDVGAFAIVFHGCKGRGDG